MIALVEDAAPVCGVLAAGCCGPQRGIIMSTQPGGSSVSSSSSSSSGGGDSGRKIAPKAEDPVKMKQKELADSIPVDKASLFAFPLDWTVVESHKIITSVMKPWVAKKVMEYLGEEEATLIQFILNKLTAHCHPADLLAELETVLDEDAESFVMKLWRMLTFSVLKAAAGC